MHVCVIEELKLLQRIVEIVYKYISYINVTFVRTSPTDLDVDIPQVQNSRQDPEELHLLVRLHTCIKNKYKFYLHNQGHD